MDYVLTSLVVLPFTLEHSFSSLVLLGLWTYFTLFMQIEKL